MTNLNKLKALALAARACIPEPWFYNEESKEVCYGNKNNPEENFPWEANALPFADSARFVAAANPQKILSMIEEIEAYREALTFYGSPENYEYNSEKAVNYIWNDQGRKARAALAELETSTDKAASFIITTRYVE
jgi:hypothetical protein